MSVNLNGQYFKQSRVVYPHGSVVNIYIVYKLDTINSLRNTAYIIQNALFVAVNITEDATDSDNNMYSGYGICFDEGSFFSFRNRIDAANVITFGCDLSSSAHANNKKIIFMSWVRTLFKV